MKPYLRIIGDVHNKIDNYISLAEQAEYSIQIGDLGFNYLGIHKLHPDKHKVLAGNHDDYEVYENQFVHQTKHFLGDYGTYLVPNVGEFFFVRGGYSIDKAYRKEGVTWWPREQLTYAEGLKALEHYKEIKPRMVISHECPTSIIDSISVRKTWDGAPIRPSMTANLLESMLDCHQPELWIFGHHHRDIELKGGTTTFRCLGELSCLDMPKLD